jgi:hypothetical protein
VECLLAEIRTNQAEMKASHEEMMAEMKAQFGSVTAKMDAWLEGMKDCREVTEARNQGKPGRSEGHGYGGKSK